MNSLVQRVLLLCLACIHYQCASYNKQTCTQTKATDICIAVLEGKGYQVSEMRPNIQEDIDHYYFNFSPLQEGVRGGQAFFSILKSTCAIDSVALYQ